MAEKDNNLNNSSSNCCSTSNCCSNSSSCCNSSTIPSIQLKNNDEIKKMISKEYSSTLKGNSSCCVSIDSTLNGYSLEEIILAGTSNLGLGCGNPLSFANLKENEIVVDLGSGAGIDCFLASNIVGENGYVIGIDMTPDMIYQARENARNKMVTNVSFRLGEIEYLPVGDNSVDVVMSNCVINLSTDKQQVFNEIYRILKPNGRIAICDVVKRQNEQLPDHLLTNEALACWVTGAPPEVELTSFLVSAGFTNVVVDIKDESKEVISQWLPGSNAEDFVVSANISATKPSNI